MTIADTLKHLAEQLDDAHGQLADGVKHARETASDSNTQHLVTQLALSSMRQEMVDRIEAVHRRVDQLEANIVKAVREELRRG